MRETSGGERGENGVFYFGVGVCAVTSANGSIKSSYPIFMIRSFQILRSYRSCGEWLDEGSLESRDREGRAERRPWRLTVRNALDIMTLVENMMSDMVLDD